MTSKLDGIAARAEAFATRGTPGRHAPEDRKDLLAALRAVEAVHTQELGGTPDGSPADICGGCPSYWPCPTIGAIREALG